MVGRPAPKPWRLVMQSQPIGRTDDGKHTIYGYRNGGMLTAPETYLLADWRQRQAAGFFEDVASS